MGASLLKQRNQSDFSLANEYHGYNWEDRQSGTLDVRNLMTNLLVMCSVENFWKKIMVFQNAHNLQDFIAIKLM